MANLLDLSLKYMLETDIDHRKKYGQYFTGKDICNKIINKLPKISNANILEPSCGSGQFISSIYDNFEKPNIDAFEIDSNLFNLVKEEFLNTNIINYDTLKFDFTKKYDYVIGNPPYFEFQPDQETLDKFKDVIKGRVNIYGLFLKLGIDLLKDGGYLAYVIPPSMNNGAYFSKLREYVIKNCSIESIEVLKADEFEDAQQTVMLMILRKEKNNGKYIFSKGLITIFSENYEHLNKTLGAKKSLKELGFYVKTGNVVWNQNKNKLSNDQSNPLLIWAHNIENGEVKINLKNKKPQFIDIDGYNNCEAIVVNRITGVGKNAKIRAAIVKNNKWVAENHVNIIFKTDNSKISFQDAYMALTNKDTLEIIQSITGNTQISKNELENLVLIDTDNINNRILEILKKMEKKFNDVNGDFIINYYACKDIRAKEKKAVLCKENNNSFCTIRLYKDGINASEVIREPEDVFKIFHEIGHFVSYSLEINYNKNDYFSSSLEQYHIKEYSLQQRINCLNEEMLAWDVGELYLKLIMNEIDLFYYNIERNKGFNSYYENILFDEYEKTKYKEQNNNLKFKENEQRIISFLSQSKYLIG